MKLMLDINLGVMDQTPGLALLNHVNTVTNCCFANNSENLAAQQVKFNIRLICNSLQEIRFHRLPAIIFKLMEFPQRIDSPMHVCIEMMYRQNLIEIRLRQNSNQDLHVSNSRQLKKIIMHVVYTNIKRWTQSSGVV